jgi:hypothetical protein
MIPSVDDGAIPSLVPPPWALAGECLVAVGRRIADAGPGLPEGLRRLPGWVVLVAARYTASPVGPYLELAVGEPAQLGFRVGLCVTTMVVDSPDSRLGGRHNWGYPKELGTLGWIAEGAAPPFPYGRRSARSSGAPTARSPFRGDCGLPPARPASPSGLRRDTRWAR